MTIGRRYGSALIIAGLLAGTLVGCGSSSKSSTATGGGGGSSSTVAVAPSGSTQASIGSQVSNTAAGLAAAQQNVNSHLQDPTSIGPTTPVGKPIPTGKTIVYINCGAQACTNAGASLKAACAVLGWNYKEIAAQPTPESIQAAFEAAVRMKPDGVASLGFSTVSYQRQLAELKAAGIPVLSDTGTDPVGNGLLLQLQSAQTAQAMALLADKAIVDDGGKGDIGNVVLTGYPIVKLYGDEFAAEIKKNCPACTLTELQIQPAQIGTTASSTIANFLRANPNVKQLFLSYDDLGNGLAAAVQGAGASAPKTYGWAPTQTGMADLRSGVQTAAVPQDQLTIGWQLADAFARSFTGQSVGPDMTWENFVLWSKEYNNLPPSDNNPPVIANYQDQFKKLWGK
jgi:ribose transport system substrate-binding protein